MRRGVVSVFQARLQGPSSVALVGRGAGSAAAAARNVPAAPPQATHGRVKTTPRLERWGGAFPSLIGGAMFRALETQADHEARRAISHSWLLRSFAERAAEKVVRLRKMQHDANSRAFGRHGINSARVSTVAPDFSGYELKWALHEEAATFAAAAAADIAAGTARERAQMELNTAMQQREEVDARLAMLAA